MASFLIFAVGVLALTVVATWKVPEGRTYVITEMECLVDDICTNEVESAVHEKTTKQYVEMQFMKQLLYRG